MSKGWLNSFAKWNIQFISTTPATFHDATGWWKATAYEKIPDMSVPGENHGMFYEAEAFNQSLIAWDVSCVVTCQSMLFGTRIQKEELPPGDAEMPSRAFAHIRAVARDVSHVVTCQSTCCNKGRVFNFSSMGSGSVRKCMVTAVDC